MSYPLLERINAPGEIKNLPASDMPALCEEIRQFLIKSVSETGGHLSSNLGVVELTVALHRVLDFPQDKLLFDVGHQCYTHKLLTGRREGFAQLRCKNGISGFPSPRESDCDAFIAGHGSAALSTAIGIARAKKLKNEPGKVVVIVGDGAFTGGMVYEGMNNVSKLNNLIVILNDNKMSISKNVGQMANYLTKLRTDPKYSHVKAHMETTLERIPVAGDALVRVLQGGKQLIRRGIYKSTMFEEMGFQYIGPIDGHDVGMLTHTLTNLRGEQYAPVFLHVVTKKGRGLKPAEENPGEFHAVSSIDYNSLFCSKRHFRVNQCFICHIRIIPAVFSDGTAYFFGTSPDIQQFQIQNNALWRMDFHFLYFFPGKQHKRRSPRCRCSAGTRRISHAEFLAAAHNICIFQACPAHVFLLNRSGGFSAGSRDLFYHNTQ